MKKEKEFSVLIYLPGKELASFIFLASVFGGQSTIFSLLLGTAGITTFPLSTHLIILNDIQKKKKIFEEKNAFMKFFAFFTVKDVRHSELRM